MTFNGIDEQKNPTCGHPGKVAMENVPSLAEDAFSVLRRCAASLVDGQHVVRECSFCVTVTRASAKGPRQHRMLASIRHLEWFLAFHLHPSVNSLRRIWTHLPKSDSWCVPLVLRNVLILSLSHTCPTRCINLCGRVAFGRNLKVACNVESGVTQVLEVCLPNGRPGCGDTDVAFAESIRKPARLCLR